MELTPASLTAIIAALTAIATLVGSVYVNRRYQKLGGGEAQHKINTTYKELNAVLEAKVVVLEGKIAGLNVTINDQTAQLVDGRRQRLGLQQDLDDLRAEVRALRVQVNGASA